jgi:biopolymer transport protein ExbD
MPDQELEYLGFRESVLADSASTGYSLAPMLDMIFLIMAVLLVVFVKLTPVEGLPVARTSAGEALVDHARSQRVEVALPASGRCEVNGRAVTRSLVVGAVNEIVAERSIDAVYILAHSSVPYGEVADVLGRLQGSIRPPVFLGTAPGVGHREEMP